MVDTGHHDVRQRILDQATRLFASRGFNGTSVQAIAEAVGIRKPSLLYHFRSKDALRQGVLDQMLTHWKDELPKVLNAASTGKDRFATGLGAVTSFFVADPNRARLVVREMLDAPESVQKLLDEHFRPWTSMIADYIRTGQKAGSIRSDVDPESWVVQVVTMCIGTIAVGDVTSALVRRDGDGDRPAVREQMTELVRIARQSLFNTRPVEPQDG
jgi:AcrR family transcriptional regulator